MPPKPSWHGRLPALRDTLAALDSPVLDRALIEQLFAVSRRAAIRLMAQVQPPRPGVANVLDREKLLAWLDRLHATRPVADAVGRQRRLETELARAAREAEARATAVALPSHHPEPDEATGLPAGVTLPEPGLLAIRFGSAQQLLGCVLALAKQAAGDYGGFRERVEGNRSQRSNAVQEPELEAAP